MNTFKALINEILGMFVDDGSLAFAILAVVALTYAAAGKFAEHPYLLGGGLYIGCLAVLVESVLRTVRSS